MSNNQEFKGLTFEEAVDKAKEIVNAAQNKGIQLRLLGALAISIQSLATKKYYKTFIKNRINGFENPFTDLDFIGYSKDREKICKLLEELGYETRGRFTAIEFDRLIYRDKTRNFVIDVFLDRLSMCHTIDFRGRLELEDLTAPLSDLLLSKMQIVNISEKDIKDTITLFLDHGVEDKDRKTINHQYIAKTLANDWGFFYTVTTNLEKLKTDFKYLYERVISKELIQNLYSKIDVLLDRIEKEPKSFSWKMRAKIGSKKKWYQDVDFQG